MFRCLWLCSCSFVLVFSISCDHAAPVPPARPVKFELFLAQETDQAGLVAVKHPDLDKDLFREATPVLTSADVSSASVSRDEMGNPAVSILLNEAAGKRFRSATQAHISKPIVIMLDGNVRMAPTVIEPLSRSLQISGKFTEAQANQIARGMMEE